ncbi:MAG: hypothetical protein V7K68_32605 [Nostoc sp.]|uniref:hypothetical protein n=1 Tax=Nostoc sp. TaxID=1180 RepID=UPI002FF541EB
MHLTPSEVRSLFNAALDRKARYSQCNYTLMLVDAVANYQYPTIKHFILGSTTELTRG